MTKPTPPQSGSVQGSLINATPENAGEAAKKTDGSKRQKYLPVIIPLRKSTKMGGWVKSDFIKHFSIDTDASGSDPEAGYYKRKASKRSETTSSTDPSSSTSTVGETVFGNGTRKQLPRGSVIKIPLGTVTEKGTARWAHFRLPSCLHSIEIAAWIKNEFKANKPEVFIKGRTMYSVETLAKHLDKLPARKKDKAEAASP